MSLPSLNSLYQWVALITKETERCEIEISANPMSYAVQISVKWIIDEEVVTFMRTVDLHLSINSYMGYSAESFSVDAIGAYKRFIDKKRLDNHTKV